MDENFYATLELQNGCLQEDIERSYKKLALKYHPDRNPGDEESAAKFVKIQQAYDTLKDPVKRRDYDTGAQGGNFFSRMNMGETEDLNIKLTCALNFEETVLGTKKLVKVHRKSPCTGCAGEGSNSFKTCPVCNGRGSVINQFGGMIRFETICNPCMGRGKIGTDRCQACSGARYITGEETSIEIAIPAGITHGITLSVNGSGHLGKNGNVGNIFVTCYVNEQKKYRLQGLDIYFYFDVDFSTMLFGGKIEIPTFESDVIELEIPEKTQNLTNFRVKGKGLTSIRNPAVRGDLIATVIGRIPDAKEFEPGLEKILKYHGI
jgi:molecular chaperone DnaJ